MTVIMVAPMAQIGHTLCSILDDGQGHENDFKEEGSTVLIMLMIVLVMVLMMVLIVMITSRGVLDVNANDRTT